MSKDVPTLTEREVQAGKDKEMRSLQDLDVYERVQKTSVRKDARIIGSRWVLRQKSSICKARLVVTEVAHSKEGPEFYAPTPSLACLRLLLAHASAMAKRGGGRGRRYVVKTGDVQSLSQFRVSR